MSDILEVMAARMQSQGVPEYGAAGESLFIHHMPEEVKRGVVLMNPYSGFQIDHELPRYYKGRFEVIVREKDHVEGKQLAKDVAQAITITTSQVVSGLDIRFVRPVNKPVIFPISDGAMLELSTHFEFAYIDLNI